MQPHSCRFVEAQEFGSLTQNRCSLKKMNFTHFNKIAEFFHNEIQYIFPYNFYHKKLWYIFGNIEIVLYWGRVHLRKDLGTQYLYLKKWIASLKLNTKCYKRNDLYVEIIFKCNRTVVITKLGLMFLNIFYTKLPVVWGTVQPVVTDLFCLFSMIGKGVITFWWKK